MSHRALALMVIAMRLSTLLIKFILNLFIAKFLGFDSLGIFGLIATTCIVAPVVTSLGFSSAINRRAVTRSLQDTITDIGHYTRYLTIPYSLIILLTIAWCAVSQSWITPPIIVAIIILEHLNSDIYYLLLNLSRPLLANSLHFLRAGLWPILYMMISYQAESFRTLDILLLTYLASTLIALACFFYATRSWPWRQRQPLGSLREWIAHETGGSRPLYANSLADTIGQNADRFVVAGVLGLELTGVYVFYTQIISAMSNLLHTGVIQIARPKLVRTFFEKDPSYFSVYKNCLRQTFLLAVAMSLAAAIITYLALPPLHLELAFEWHAAFLLMLAGFIMYILTQVGDSVLYSQHKDTITLKLSLSYFSSRIIVCIALVPLFGLWGTGITTIASSAIKMVFQQWVLRKVLVEAGYSSGSPDTRTNLRKNVAPSEV